MIRVSVVVPVYNDKAAIIDCLSLLLRQSYPGEAYEIIVADNGSSDSTQQAVRDLCEQHGDRLRLVVEDQIQSSYAARNRGIQAATGDIFAFTDADCRPDSNWLAAGVDALLAQEAACGGGRIVFSYQAERPNMYEYFDSARKLNQKAYIEQAGFAATANFFARKAVVESIGSFRSDLISGGDYEFGRRVTNAGEKMIYIPDALITHPARSTFPAIYKKSRRVAQGQKQLADLGLLEHGQVSSAQLRFRRSYPIDERWTGTLSRKDKMQLIFMGNFFNWLNYTVRRF